MPSQQQSLGKARLVPKQECDTASTPRTREHARATSGEAVACAASAEAALRAEGRRPPGAAPSGATQGEETDVGEDPTRSEHPASSTGRSGVSRRAWPRVRRAHPRRRGRLRDGEWSAFVKGRGFDIRDCLTDQDFSIHTTRGTPDPVDRGLTFTVDTLPTMPGAALLARKRSAALVHEAQTGKPVSPRYFVELLGAFVASPSGLQQPFLVSMPAGPLKAAVAALHGRVLSGLQLNLQVLYGDYLRGRRGAAGVAASANHAATIAEWSRVAMRFRAIGAGGRERILGASDADVTKFFKRLVAPIDNPDRPSVDVARQFLKLVDANIRELPRGGAFLGAFVGRLVHDAMTNATVEEMGLLLAPGAGRGIGGCDGERSGDVPSTFRDLLEYLTDVDDKTRTAIVEHIDSSGLFALATALRDAMAAGTTDNVIADADLPLLDSLTVLLTAILNARE